MKEIRNIYTGWLIYGKKEENLNKHYIDFYKEEGKKYGITFKLLTAENISFGVYNNKRYLKYENSKIDMPDFVIVRIIYPLLSKHLEMMGIPVFNPYSVADICNDKAKTYQYIADLSIPVVDTEFCKKEFANERIKHLEFPSVIKTVNGHGGTQVFLLQEEKDRAKILEVLEKEDIVIQPLTGTKRQDLRVYVIGKEIIASVLRTGRESFKSNFSLGGAVELYDLNKSELKIVTSIIDRFEFGMAGIDFIIGNDGELIFNEIEDVVGARMLYKLTDINLVEKYLKYIIDKFQ